MEASVTYRSGQTFHTVLVDNRRFRKLTDRYMRGEISILRIEPGNPTYKSDAYSPGRKKVNKG